MSKGGVRKWKRVPKISIILPVYNGEAFLAECVDSVLAQTEGDFELLIADDGSSDGSRAILARYRDPRLKVLLNEKNVGLFGNLNLLVARAAAPLVRFLCQDDALASGCIAEDVEYFRDNGEVVMSICSVDEVDEQGRVVGEWTTGDVPEVFDTAWCLQKLMYEGCIAGNLSTVCVRRDVLERAGPFDETYEVAGDYEMWVRVCLLGPVAERYHKLVRLRGHKGRLSEAPFSGVKFVRENRRVVEKLIPLLPAEIRGRARRYTWRKQNVFDTNYLMRCLLAGRFAQVRQTAVAMGVRRLIPGVAAWLLTLNNRLYNPKMPFVGRPLP